MTTTLVLPPLIADDIARKAALDVESAGVLLARLALIGGTTRLLAREIIWTDSASYLERSNHHMAIESSGYVPALSRAEADGSIAIWLHIHPGDDGVPEPSSDDVEVDRAIADLFRLRSGARWHGTLIASPRGDFFTFTGKLEDESGTIVPVDRIWAVGERWRLVPAFEQDAGGIDPMFDRNVRAFGPGIQSLLGDLRIGIVGSGGTGSAVVEQLVRLGVRDILLMDTDSLSLSNVTRVYGSSPSDVGRAKVDVLRDHLMRICPSLCCRTTNAMSTSRSAAEELAQCDLVFGCSDDNAGRLVLSRLSTYFLLPVIDMGVLISSGVDGTITGVDGRVTTLSPGAACLVCRDRVDLARAAAELRTPEERQRLADEGYAPALGQTEPAVVAFTTAVAAAAVNDFLDRLIGYGPPDRPSETLLRMHEREISTNSAEPREGHYCHQAQGRWGAGCEEPFLGQLWPAA